MGERLMIRGGEGRDVARVVELADLKRQQYRHYAPLFHRPHREARQRHAPFLTGLIASGKHLVLVHESESEVDGFVIAAFVPPPPVYDPGGLTCLIDDFMVAEPELWSSVGRVLLQEACRRARGRGAVQSIVVCGPLDHAKREMLLDSGHTVASEWLTRPFEARS